MHQLFFFLFLFYVVGILEWLLLVLFCLFLLHIFLSLFHFLSEHTRTYVQQHTHSPQSVGLELRMKVNKLMFRFHGSGN